MLVIFLRKLKWRNLLFILMRNIHTLFDHVFNSLEPTVLNCIEQWGLSVLVDDVDVCSIGYQLLYGLVVAFTHTVENWSLTICVDVIRI